MAWYKQSSSGFPVVGLTSEPEGGTQQSQGVQCGQGTESGCFEVEPTVKRWRTENRSKPQRPAGKAQFIQVVAYALRSPSLCMRMQKQDRQSHSTQKVTLV